MGAGESVKVLKDQNKQLLSDFFLFETEDFSEISTGISLS